MKTMKFSKEGRRWELPDAFYRVSIKLIIKNSDDKLLVLVDNTTGLWELPGGGLDHGESIRQTAEREVKEELSVELHDLNQTSEITLIGLHPDNYATLKIYYSASLASFEFAYEEDFEAKFVTKSEFIELPMAGDESPIKSKANIIWP